MFGRHSNPNICPIRALELYVKISTTLQINLSNGFLLRPLSPRGTVVYQQLSTSAIQLRLREHLINASIYEGETLHTFRAGAAITLALSGSQLADSMTHVGWRTAPSASYYLKLAQVIRLGGPSELLPNLDTSLDEA